MNRHLRKSSCGEHLIFYCPDCRQLHSAKIKGEGAWGFNDDMVKPTLSPSYLMRSGHHATTFKPGEPCWCTYEQRLGEPSPFQCGVCHFFLKEGVIEYLNDCTHDHAGKKVPLFIK